MFKFFAKRKEKKEKLKQQKFEEEQRLAAMRREQETPFIVHPPEKQIHYLPDTKLLEDCIMEEQMMTSLVTNYPNKYKQRPKS